MGAQDNDASQPKPNLQSVHLLHYGRHHLVRREMCISVACQAGVPNLSVFRPSKVYRANGAGAIHTPQRLGGFRYQNDCRHAGLQHSRLRCERSGMSISTSYNCVRVWCVMEVLGCKPKGEKWRSALVSSSSLSYPILSCRSADPQLQGQKLAWALELEP